MSLNLKALPGFAEWVREGVRAGHLEALAEFVDEKVGDTGYHCVQPHHAHINLGMQDAVRRVRRILRDPLGADEVVAAGPPATYGVSGS